MSDAAAHAWGITLQYLKDRRDELGISDYRLAQLSGVDKSQISRIFAGTVTPGILQFYRICAALQLNALLVPKEADDTPYPRMPGTGHN